MKTNTPATLVAAGIIADSTPAIPIRVYFGTQAKDPENGIYMASFNAQTGQLGEPIRVSNSVRPGFIVIHPNGQTLYATDTTGSFTGGSRRFVSSYRIKPDGALIDLNTQQVGTGGTCHISLSPDNRSLLAADYSGGCCAVLPILENGTVGEPTSVKQHSGSGPNKARQESAHTHSFNNSLDGQYALAADLGIDQLLSYRLDDGLLTLHSITKTAPGAGPRHLTFHPNGQFAYVSMELNGTVAAYHYKDGALTELQTLPTLPDGFADENTVSEVRITPDGRFLYVGNRGHESLAIFAVDPATGILTAQGHESTRGKHPRHFNIDPSGRYLLCANMHSDSIVVFRIDQKTGHLEFTGSETSVLTPSCIQFHPAP